MEWQLGGGRSYAVQEKLWAGPEQDRSGNEKGPWISPRAFSIDGRNERIRTSDPLLPKQVRYQAALHSGSETLTGQSGGEIYQLSRLYVKHFERDRSDNSLFSISDSANTLESHRCYFTFTRYCRVKLPPDLMLPVIGMRQAVTLPSYPSGAPPEPVAGA